MNMIEHFINFVIRPPRAVYDPNLYLWDPHFTIAGKAYIRQDLELVNGRGHTLKCSHYMPASLNPHSPPLPCVIYCHGNSGCRADANEPALLLLPSNITVFTLDFSGSGLSDGLYVSLGSHEKDDLKVVVSHLRSDTRVSRIGLWGRSMGAVTSLLYGSEDPSISAMVLDSAFSNLFDLMMELVDVYKIRLPKFTVKVALQYMRRVIQKRAKFDIMDLNCVQVAGKTFIPALFAHANEDKFIPASHSDTIFKCYAGDKNIIKFDGDHNSSRPQSYYDSISAFFSNTLQPPTTSSPCENKIEKCQSLEDFRGVAGMDKVHENGCHIYDKSEGDIEECCSNTSSNRESWGRCSSLEGSDSVEYPPAPTNQQMMSCDGDIAPQNTEKKGSRSKKKVKNVRHEKLEKIGFLGRRLRLCILRFERAWDPVLAPNAQKQLSYYFLNAFEKWFSFDTNPLYAILHESIYCQGAPSQWSAHRVRAAYETKFDAVKAAKERRPVYFTGEMIFPWMFDELPALKHFKEAANLLSEKNDWSALYDTRALENNKVPVAAAVYYEDMYVNFKLVMETARHISGIRLWITNEYMHSGLRDGGSHVFEHLMGMLNGKKPLF